MTLRRVESHRRRRKERARRRAAFLTNPYLLTKQFLGQKKGGRLTCSSDEINNHIKCSYSDPKKDQPLESCKALINPPEPVLRFDLKEPSLTRWRKSSGGREPSQHRDQVKYSENIDQFRIISLLSVESKIFFSIVA